MDAESITARFDSLVAARRTQDNLMQSIGRLVAPYRSEFYKPLATSAEVQWERPEVVDSTAVADSNLLASKIHTNLTSPATKWYELRFRSDDLNDGAPKEWLEDADKRTWWELGETDFDTEVAELYLDLVVFGTSIIMVEPKKDIEWDGADFTTFPIQDTYFEMGGDNLPSRVYRKFRYTKLQIQERFDVDEGFDWGENDSSSEVDTKYDVIFCVYWRDRDSEPEKALAPELRPVGYKYIFKRTNHQFEEGGYYEYPAMVVRWRKTAGTDWGYSPSMVLMPDIRQLQEVVSQNSEARAKHIDPPLKTTDRGLIQDGDLTPGSLLFVQEMDELAPVFPPIDMRPGVEEVERLQEAIHRGYLLDMLQMKESPQMTATEVRARLEEIMQTMAPTLGRLKNDLLIPVVEKMFNMMMRSGQFEQAPEELSGVELDIQFTSPLARAQEGDMARGYEIWLAGIMGMAEFNPGILDNVDFDDVARRTARLLGVASESLNTEEEVTEVRQAKAEKQEAMEQAQMMQEAGKGLEATGKGAAALAAVE
jgi:hypothetical protein